MADRDNRDSASVVRRTITRVMDPAVPVGRRTVAHGATVAALAVGAGIHAIPGAGPVEMPVGEVTGAVAAAAPAVGLMARMATRTFANGGVE